MPIIEGNVPELPPSGVTPTRENGVEKYDCIDNEQFYLVKQKTKTKRVIKSVILKRVSFS